MISLIPRYFVFLSWLMVGPSPAALIVMSLIGSGIVLVLMLRRSFHKQTIALPGRRTGRRGRPPGARTRGASLVPSRHGPRAGDLANDALAPDEGSRPADGRDRGVGHTCPAPANSPLTPACGFC